MNEKEIDTVPAEPNHGGPQDEDLTIQEDTPVKKEKKKKKKTTFKDKWIELWQDKRSFKTRFAPALFVSMAFVYTFYVFGPFELFLSNMTFFAFSGRAFCGTA